MACVEGYGSQSFGNRNTTTMTLLAEVGILNDVNLPALRARPVSRAFPVCTDRWKTSHCVLHSTVAEAVGGVLSAH